MVCGAITPCSTSGQHQHMISHSVLNAEMTAATITLYGLNSDLELLRPTDHGYSIVLVPIVVYEEDHVQEQLLALA